VINGKTIATSRYAPTPTALQIIRYPATKSADCSGHGPARFRTYWAYTRTTGATAGNIIADIITTHVARKIVKLPKSAPADIIMESPCAPT
jgi:hypothetical protein